MSPAASRVRRVAAAVIRLSRPGDNEYLDRGCESGIGDDERGQEAGPPVRAVRARDGLQLDRPRVLPGVLRTCRK
jgi:hypothetical protein